MPLQDETELFWQAFRYVGEEMAPAEASDFELQLADQQAAREAVARVVELSQLVLAAAPEQSPVDSFVSPARHSQTWMQPVGWIAVGAAACLAVVMAYQSLLPAVGTTQTASTSPSAASDLALAWAVAQAPNAEEAPAIGSSTDLPAHEGDVAGQTKVSGGDLPSAVPMEEFTEPVAPAWLLVAVEDARAGAPQEN